jgi:hypothetical protein
VQLVDEGLSGNSIFKAFPEIGMSHPTYIIPSGCTFIPFDNAALLLVSFNTNNARLGFLPFVRVLQASVGGHGIPGPGSGVYPFEDTISFEMNATSLFSEKTSQKGEKEVIREASERTGGCLTYCLRPKKTAVAKLYMFLD